MSLENAFETGRLYKPLRDIADKRKDIVSSFMLLPGLRSFWPMSATDGTGYILDYVAGNSYRLSPEGTPVIKYDYPTHRIEFDGSSEYLWGADGSLRDVTATETYINSSINGLTLGGWVYHNDLTGYQGFIAKFGAAGAQSYTLQKVGTTHEYRFIMSDNGTSQSFVDTDPVEAGQWYFVVGRFRPSVAVDVFLNTVMYSTATAKTSVYNSTTEFKIGASGSAASPSLYLKGAVSMCFLCAAALPDTLIDDLYQISRDMFGV